MNNTYIIAAATLLLGLVGGYALATHDGVYGERERGGRDESHGTHMMHGGGIMKDEDMGMMGGGHMMMVASEREFLTEMIPHHQEAVDTAREVLARGATTPEIRTLVEGIISAQEKEISDMKKWYQEWYGTAYVPSGTYQPMMRDLTVLSGVELDKAFLEDMVMHHMGAIMMARSVEAHIEHDEIRALSAAIIESQTEEIGIMQRLRAGL